MKTSARLTLTCAALLLLSASPALAATATISGDGGSPVPLSSGMTLRHLAPNLNFTFADGETHYAARVVGPGGQAASGGTSCTRTSSPFEERVRYQGNGTYTLSMKVADSFDACEAATEQSVPFAINASTAISPPASQPLLTRQPGSFAAINFTVPVSLNPGADSYEFRYAPNATIGPDGGIAGEASSGFVDTTAGTASISFSKPGRYTLVVRAKSFRSDVPTAWSPRIDVTVVAPFDLNATSFPDSRGPSYQLSGQIRETTATGKVTVSIAKGKKGRKFRRLGSAKIRRGGKFKLRFRLAKAGTYTLRYSYKGGATVDRGTVTEVIRISRRIF